jgi:diaminopimelate dehydrogenase
VIRTGKTGLQDEHTHTIEYRLQLDSNPEFTASVLVAYARAVHRLAERGDQGCKTVFDIAPADLSPLSGDEFRATML